MRPYTQLTQAERYQIYALMQTQQIQKAMAQVPDVHTSMGSHELRQN